MCSKSWIGRTRDLELKTWNRNTTTRVPVHVFQGRKLPIFWWDLVARQRPSAHPSEKHLEKRIKY